MPFASAVPFRCESAPNSTAPKHTDAECSVRVISAGWPMRRFPHHHPMTENRPPTDSGEASHRLSVLV